MTTKILHLEKYVADFSYTRQFQQNTDKIKSSITITEKVSVSKKIVVLTRIMIFILSIF
jgi:hypothetical protein